MTASTTSPGRDKTGSYRLAVVNGGTSDPSSTGMLARRIAERIATLSAEDGSTIRTSVIDLRPLASDITTAMLSGLVGEKLNRAIELLGDADGIVAASPVYKAAPSGLFSSFFHILDNDLLIGKPVLLAATAGTARHALVIDDQMRSLFAFMRTLTAPTAVCAATDDWDSSQLGSRIDRAAYELVLLMRSGFARQIKERTWNRYQHEYGSGGGTELNIDLSTDLMRLAAGGSA